MSEVLDITIKETDNKAVAVAKDVLQHLQVYRWHCGMYIYGALEDASWTDDLQKHADEATSKCYVCLKGACLISKARLFDDVPLAAFAPQVGAKRVTLNGDDGPITDLLGTVFDTETLELMECAFEMSYCFARTVSKERALDAVQFARDAELPYTGGDSSEHFRANKVNRVKCVMENVIANNGKFLPPPPPAPTPMPEQSQLVATEAA